MENLAYLQKKYLFAICKLSQNEGEVKSEEVAKIVGVSKFGTITMTARLCGSGVKAANSIFTNCIIIGDFSENTLGIYS